MESSEKYLTNILTGLVQNPDAIRVERSQDEMGVLLSVSVARDDMGRVIGREGATAKAIRRLIDAHGSSLREKVSVKIIEPLV
jgi:predicted RNA-binding protein YlqC (UPF0109 family)